jgi:hypothetical protein
MPTTDRDRKLLWGSAGNTCALCKCRLREDAKGADRDVVLGEEAHIVSEAPNGPRFRLLPRDQVDAYANLLLLCPSDHKKVDEQVTHFSEQRLLTIKREHEQWVKDRLSATMPQIKIRDPEPDKPMVLQRIETGKQLMNVVAHTVAEKHDHPEPRSAEEAELMGGVFQNAIDYSDLWDDIGPSGRMQAEFSISKDIDRLREAGFAVYAGAKNHVLEGGMDGTAPWPVSYIVIRRHTDESE